MKITKEILVVMALCGLLAWPARAQEGPPFAAENFSGTVTLTSTYMYRGISFSDDTPALQGSFDWSYGPFALGVWSSSLSDQDGSGTELESDFYAIYSNRLGGLEWELMPVYYYFFNYDSDDVRNDAGEALDANMFELIWSGSYSLNDMLSVSLSYGWTPDYFFEAGTGHYVHGGPSVSLPGGFNVDGAIGWQSVEGGDSSDSGWDYTHWEVGISRDVVGFTLDARYHSTSDDSQDDDLIREGGFTTDNTDGIFVFSVSRTF